MGLNNLQTGGTGGLRNLTEIIGGVPAENDLHAWYDFTEEDGTAPVTDQTGNGYDIGGSYTGVGESINGVQAGEFDGTDDQLSVTFADENQPTTIGLVFRLRSSGGNAQTLIDGADKDEHAFRESGSNNWAINAPNTLGDGGADVSNHIAVILFDGANSGAWLDGTSIIGGDAGSDAMQGITLGTNGAGGNAADMAVGEALYYPSDKTGIRSDIETYLSDKWSIAV